MRTLKRWIVLSIATIILCLPKLSLAQVNPPDDQNFGLDNLENAGVNLGKRDVYETTSGIINIVLGLLGILATVIVLVGGFKWMTSGGNRDTVDEAKKLLSAGIIGLVIILSAYAIARFVITSLREKVL